MKNLPVCIRHQFGHQTVISRKLCRVKEAPDERKTWTPCQLYLDCNLRDAEEYVGNTVLEDIAS